METVKKYLHYKPVKKYGEGLLDRRSCLMILLAEAKLSGRIAVVPKFRLGSHHNNGKDLESYLIGDYFEIDRLNVDYILEEDFSVIQYNLKSESILNIDEAKFDYSTDQILVQRHLKDDNYWRLKLYDVFPLAKLYHGVGVKFVIPEVTPTREIEKLGNEILSRLEKPTIGLHLRRGDRLNRKLNDSMNGETFLNKLNKFSYSSVYYATNDTDYKITNRKFFSSSDFPDVLGDIIDNYLLFAIEMYVIDNCDISVRTFNDSSPFYYIKDKSNKNYSICNYSMHGSNNSFKKVPMQLVKCSYEDKTKINRKSFVKRTPLLPRLIMAIKRKLKLV
ncbi:hypothetical protein [Winogradskyella flava]|uniref:Uncharacterized protein n=1 Tax=Winogradskyella flava TaxID=1884876 RepID=A0A842ILL1_9FLAO|nr:hypothetical protein [Winogradskyella flava]MBC2843515.1 hypothetical protein [Winogradskyella flava]